MSFNLREFIKKGVLTEEDLEELQSTIEIKNYAPNDENGAEI